MTPIEDLYARQMQWEAAESACYYRLLHTTQSIGARRLFEAVEAARHQSMLTLWHTLYPQRPTIADIERHQSRRAG